MTPENIIEKGAGVLSARSAWDSKQALFTQMRHEGIRRRNKPFETAADYHLAILDLTIRKHRAFWFGQVFNNDRLAVFLALRQQAEYLSKQAGEWFDWLVRSESNCLDQFQLAQEAMLLRGRGVLKAWLDATNDNKLTFAGIDPQFVLMADGADDFADADWFIEVKQLSRGRYERDPRYDHTPGTWETISGQGTDNQTAAQYWTDKEQREGITNTTNTNTAVVWECWEQHAAGKWTVHTVSPRRTDRPLRQNFECPYKTATGASSLPYHSLVMELKEPGWYAPRGLADLVAPSETLGCTIVNRWLDALSFSTNPIFTSDGPIPNLANIKFRAGEVLPGGIKRVDMGGASMELPALLNFVQGAAEQSAMMPDFGVGDRESQQDKRTATEVNRIAGVMDVATSFNGEMIRRRMQRVYQHVWAMLLQFKPKSLAYLAGDSLNELPEAALHDQYSLRVGGRSDQWNQAQAFQRAAARYQMLGADPNANHEELVSDLLTADDPSAAKRILVRTNVRAANESEDEAQELTILADGYPAAVGPNEDHAARIHIDLAWLQKEQAAGLPHGPDAYQRVKEHLAVHYGYLKKADPQQAGQVAQSVQQMEQAAMQPPMPAGPMPGQPLPPMATLPGNPAPPPEPML